MNTVSCDTKTTLLLNNAWQPINAITARAAFVHLLKGRVTAIDKNGGVFNSLSSWNTLAQYHDDQPVLRSSKTTWPIPTIIVVTSRFFRRPKKKKFTLFDLAKINDHTCQYCLQKYKLADLTIDHIIPKSKGGTDDHENRVLACRQCNSKKSSHIPWFDANGNIPIAPEIPHIFLNCSKIREEWMYFLK